MGLGAVLGSIASRWVCIVSRRGLLLLDGCVSFLDGCIAFLGEGYRFPVGVLYFSERRVGALYSVSTRVVNVLSVCGVWRNCWDTLLSVYAWCDVTHIGLDGLCGDCFFEENEAAAQSMDSINRAAAPFFAIQFHKTVWRSPACGGRPLHKAPP